MKTIKDFVKERYNIKGIHLNNSDLCLSGNDIIKTISEYVKQMQVSVEWQLCPKCQGEGRLFNSGTSTSVHRVCDVCNGMKTIMPIILPK